MANMVNGVCGECKKYSLKYITIRMCFSDYES